MPAKRKPAASSSKPTAPRPRQSALAKEHNLTAREESEIQEAFSLFSTPEKGHKYGVIPTSEIRSALVALGIPPSSRAEQAEFVEILDPEGEGHARYEDFFAICALKYHAREDGDEEGRAEEVEEAFRLFTAGRLGGAGRMAADEHEDEDEDVYEVRGKGKGRATGDVITLGDLKRVAAVLKEDVSEERLRDMILEANAGAGVGVGVGKGEFEEVMKRAGVFK